LPARQIIQAGIDVFIREEYIKIVLDSWKFARKRKVLKLTDGVSCPSHIHMIIGSSRNKLADIVLDMKKHTSLELRAAIKNNVSESRKECPPERNGQG